MSNSYILEAIVTALSSISHGGETRSTTQIFRREKIVTKDGKVLAIPVVSGNSIRGVLRDAGSLAMLEALEMDKGTLSMAAFDFLFSGGSLNKDAGRAIDIKRARRFKELLPIVGVFGGSIGDQIIEGKLQIGKLLPICKETWHIIPDHVKAKAGVELRAISINQYLQVEAYTRRDDKKQENLRPLMTTEANEELDNKSLAKRRTRKLQQDLLNGPPKNTPVDPEAGQHQQMRYYVETLAAGVKFYWWIGLQRVTDLEFQAFQTALMEFQRHPYIGGKGNVGHGRVSIEFINWGQLPSIQAWLTQTKPELAKDYLDHLKAHKTDIQTLLKELS